MIIGRGRPIYHIACQRQHLLGFLADRSTFCPTSMAFSVTRFRELSPDPKGIFVVFRDQGRLVRDFFFNSEHAQMGHVWSGHVQSVYTIWCMYMFLIQTCARMHGSSFSSGDDCY